MPTFREVIAMSAFVNLLALAVPVFTMQVYNRVIAGNSISTLQGLVIGMGLVVVFDYVLRMARSRIMQTVALRVDVMVGKRLFEKVMSLPMQTLESHDSSHWGSLFRDVDNVRNTLSGASAVLIADLPFAVFFLGLIFIIASPLAWVLMVIIPLFMFVAWRSGKVVAEANREERVTGSDRDTLIAEIISGRTTVKALALDGAIRPIWEEKHADNIERSIIRGGTSDRFSNLGASLTMLTSVSLTTVGALEIINHNLTIGALVATNMLSGRLLNPLNQLVGQWRGFTGFLQAVDRLGEVFSSPSERTVSEISMERPNGEIIIEKVSFSYIAGAAPVVDSVELKINVGGIQAMVGRNGSGKSTLLKLIQGLYTPSSGRILLDGADISQFTRSEMAGWMGYVPQDTVLFAGSVRDNITKRKPDASDEEIIRAAEETGVHRYIIDMPDGYATEIGEAGQRLSGGQRQRIAIARALVGNPPILLLDEPSSSLDRQAEQELRKTLVKISKERTVVIVTHSPILLAACDHLVALDRGKVAISGPAKDILPKLFGAAAKPRPKQNQPVNQGAVGHKQMPSRVAAPQHQATPQQPQPQQQQPQQQPRRHQQQPQQPPRQAQTKPQSRRQSSAQVVIPDIAEDKSDKKRETKD